MKYLAIFSFFACVMLNSCCTSCDRIWIDVGRGEFNDPVLQKAMTAVLEKRSPRIFKSMARVMVERSGNEMAFSLYAKVNRDDRSLQLAGMTDIGNVIFTIQVTHGVTTITKNTSGWSQSVLRDVLTPLCQTILTPSLNENAIVQEGVGCRLLHRSKRRDGCVENYIFDQKGTRWKEYKLQSFALFGKPCYLQRVTFSEFKSVAGLAQPFPHHTEVSDERHGFKATISVRSLTTL